MSTNAAFFCASDGRATNVPVSCACIAEYTSPLASERPKPPISQVRSLPFSCAALTPSTQYANVLSGRRCLKPNATSSNDAPVCGSLPRTSSAPNDCVPFVPTSLRPRSNGPIAGE